MRRLIILIISSLLVGLFIIGGCDFFKHDIQGPERGNVPPVVQFVNIPVEKARFNSDTTVNWYGTDVDGFIVQFRYAVVEESIVGLDPDAYISGTADTLIPWVVLDVSVNDPQTNARITMSADISDPVRKYVASYVFIQAIDNLGARSEVANRLFYKNNHFPNTTISARGVNDPYVNTSTVGGILEGVTVGWSGEDPIDYPRNPPPFQFRWRFYGPFDSLQMVALENTCIDSVFVDIYGDFYIKGDTFVLEGDPDTLINNTVTPPETTIVIDTSWVLVDTLGRNNSFGSWNDYMYLDSFETHPDLNKLVDSSYDPLADDIWVYDQNTHIYDVYRDTTITTTSQFYFLIWCQARDDSNVPDPVPDFKWVSVIEPKFEREVLIIDATRYRASTSGFWNWPVFPQSPYDVATTEPMIKQVLGQMIEDWAGPGSFDFTDTLPDVSYVFPDGSRCSMRFNALKASQDYYPIVRLNGCETYGIPSVLLRDILKHKIVLVVKDNPGGELIMDSDIMLSVLDGLNAGMSAWAMLRSPFQSVPYVTQPQWQNVPFSYTRYFGVVNMRFSGWMGAINDTRDNWINAGTRIEDFVGATPLIDSTDYIDLPPLVIDTTLLEGRYLWVPGAGFSQYDYRCPNAVNPPGEILIGALPEVGYVQKYILAKARYLYESKYDNEPPFMSRACNRGVGIWEKANGAVVGITFDAGLFRTAHFSFSLLPFEQDAAETCFNNMMDWLAVQPFIHAGKINAGGVPKANIQQLRDITNDLHEKKKLGLLRSVADGE